MCEMQDLRASVEQILTAAAEEIFGVFKRSIAQIEEKLNNSSKHNKRNQRLPEAVHQTDILILPEEQGCSAYVDQEDPEPPHIKEEKDEEWISQEEEQTVKLRLLSECPTLNKKQWLVKEEPPLEQQDRSPNLDEVDPEPPHTKEQENLWTNQEGDQLQGLEEADFTQFTSTLPHVTSEYDEDEAQSSQLHQSQTMEPEDGGDYGGSEPNSIQSNDFPISDVTCKTTQHGSTEDDKTSQFLSVPETQRTIQTTKKLFYCSVCNKGFVRQGKLKVHMSVHTGERPFCCTVCKRGFADKGNLNKHKLVHTRETPFCCSVCKKCFAYKSNLKKHMSIHTGEKPFSCSVCKKPFADKGNLNRHMLVHPGEKPFFCSVCNKGFIRKFELRQHVAVSHPFYVQC